jgi:hypothetical protein
LPDFDDGQQLESLSLSEAELMLASSRPSLDAQVYCVLQIGYFKAKHAFFRFAWDEAEDDIAFVLSRYYNDQAFSPIVITKHEHYTQRALIAELTRTTYGLQCWLGRRTYSQNDNACRNVHSPMFHKRQPVIWNNNQLSSQKIFWYI